LQNKKYKISENLGLSMNTQVSVFIATSFDGYIARKNGSLDWLDQANTVAPVGEDCGYKAFMESVDVLVMGRNTYEKVLTFGAWPYGQKRVVVLSSGAVDIADDLQGTVSSSSEAPAELVARLSAEGCKRLYIDGGITIQRFLRAGLVDDLTITLVPVIIGEGKPLFGPLEKDISLIHVSTQAYDFGYVQMKYRVKK
jgi:dihydrofolate reductase